MGLARPSPRIERQSYNFPRKTHNFLHLFLVAGHIGTISEYRVLLLFWHRLGALQI